MRSHRRPDSQYLRVLLKPETISADGQDPAQLGETVTGAQMAVMKLGLSTPLRRNTPCVGTVDSQRLPYQLLATLPSVS